MKTIQDTLFVNSTREMVSLSFELDKEGSGIIFFFFLLRSWQIEILLALFLYRAKKTNHLFHSIYKKAPIYIADPGNMQDGSHIWTS